jgi:hypothetical protein
MSIRADQMNEAVYDQQCTQERMFYHQQKTFSMHPHIISLLLQRLPTLLSPTYPLRLSILLLITPMLQFPLYAWLLRRQERRRMVWPLEA